MTQLVFTFSGLTCSFGEPVAGPHPLCAQQGVQARVEFDKAVARGDYDAQGYSISDRKAQAKKVKAA